MEHHYKQIHDDSSHDIKKLNEELSTFNSKIQEAIRNDRFLPDEVERSNLTLKTLNHHRGIGNTSFNCWLSSIIHLICSTGFIDLLLS